LSIIASQSFGKAEKLKSRKQIDQLFGQGKSFGIFPLRVYYAFESLTEAHQQIAAKAGVTVSSKNFKKAVDRNRIKRVLREVYRLQKNELLDQLLDQQLHVQLFFIYTDKVLPDYATCHAKMKMALQKLKQLANEVVAANT
jgi:ribonuclease P protein component